MADDDIPVLRLAKIRIMIDRAFEPEDTRKIDTVTLVKRLIAERADRRNPVPDPPGTAERRSAADLAGSNEPSSIEGEAS